MGMTAVVIRSAGFSVLPVTKFVMTTSALIVTLIPNLALIRGRTQLVRTIRIARTVIYAWWFIRIA